MKQLTPSVEDREAFAGQATAAALDGSHHIGSYRRELPVSMARMIENARDWEHLPFVHPGSFAAIALIDQGEWGWRAKTALPGGGEQLLELLVDAPRHAWTTTVVEGQGKGVQIHTQASELNDGIVVEVDFYLPTEPEARQGEKVLAALQAQYAMLYDEDDALMQGRQAALDARGMRRSARACDLGPVADLDPEGCHPVELAAGRFVVRRHNGEWIAHAAVCPHMLGPLGEGEIDGEGRVVCPWHGYRFSLADGSEALARCGPLPAPPRIDLADGRLRVSC